MPLFGWIIREKIANYPLPPFFDSFTQFLSKPKKQKKRRQSVSVKAKKEDGKIPSSLVVFC